MSKIIKIIDERETQRKKKEKKNQWKGSFSERVRDERFYWVFKLGFLPVICKASLTLKSNLGLASSIILKQRQL